MVSDECLHASALTPGALSPSAEQAGALPSEGQPGMSPSPQRKSSIDPSDPQFTPTYVDPAPTPKTIALQSQVLTLAQQVAQCLDKISGMEDRLRKVTDENNTLKTKVEEKDLLLRGLAREQENRRRITFGDKLLKALTCVPEGPLEHVGIPKDELEAVKAWRRGLTGIKV